MASPQDWGPRSVSWPVTSRRASSGGVVEPAFAQSTLHHGEVQVCPADRAAMDCPGRPGRRSLAERVRACAAISKRPSTSSSSAVSSRFRKPQTCGEPIGGRRAAGHPRNQGVPTCSNLGLPVRPNEGEQLSAAADPHPPSGRCARAWRAKPPVVRQAPLHCCLAGHRSTRSSRDGWSLAASMSLIARARARRRRQRARNLSMTIRLGRVDPDTRLTQVALAPASIAVCGPRRGD